MKLRQKLLLLTILPLLLALGGQALFAAHEGNQTLVARLDEKARSLAAVLVGTVGPNILFQDAKAAHEGLVAVQPDSELAFAGALLPGGVWLAQVGKPESLARFKVPPALPASMTVFAQDDALVAVMPVRNDGKVVGAVVVGLSRAGIEATASRTARTTALLALFCLACCVGFAWLVARHMLGPLGLAVSALQAMSRGDLTARLAQSSGDEIGAIANALNEASGKLGGALHGALLNLNRLAGASSALSAMSERLGGDASSTSAKATSVATAAAIVSDGTSTVSGGIEQMTASIKGIADSAAEAARIALGAVQTAESASRSIEKLDESSTAIGQVAQAIAQIASRTNLLALNATIEAARAGEAGRGFAVVASEVKDLAQQTALATTEIASKMTGIRAAVQGSVEAIRSISAVIEKVNGLQAAIAAAVGEQAHTTREIAKNIAGAANASASIARDTEALARAAKSTLSCSQESRDAAAELLRVSSTVKELMAGFRLRQPEAASPAASAQRTLVVETHENSRAELH